LREKEIYLNIYQRKERKKIIILSICILFKLHGKY
jgi:hypothetical protein